MYNSRFPIYKYVANFVLMSAIFIAINCTGIHCERHVIEIVFATTHIFTYTGRQHKKKTKYIVLLIFMCKFPGFKKIYINIPYALFLQQIIIFQNTSGFSYNPKKLHNLSNLFAGSFQNMCIL